MKKTQYRKLISKVNHCHLNVYIKRLKAYNALIIQLKINKIKFNKFLYEKYFFNVLTAQYLSNLNEKHIIVKYILFFCLN